MKKNLNKKRENLLAKAGHMSSILWSGRYPGEGNGKPTPLSCLDNPMDRDVYSPWGCKRIRHDLATKQHYFKVLLNLLQYCFCFMFQDFGCEASGILTPQPGVRPVSTALEEILATGLPGKSLIFYF